MASKINYNRLVEDLFKAKEYFHKSLAKLPFERKIEILVRLQKIAQGFNRSISKKRVWKL